MNLIHTDTTNTICEALREEWKIMQTNSHKSPYNFWMVNDIEMKPSPKCSEKVEDLLNCLKLYYSGFIVVSFGSFWLVSTFIESIQMANNAWSELHLSCWTFRLSTVLRDVERDNSVFDHWTVPQT